MRHRASIVLAVAASLACAAPALADGPFEPNETAATAAAPMVMSVVAGLETPQDVDWFALYPKRTRQIGVLVKLTSSCGSNTGSVRVDLLDADAGILARSIGSGTLGWDPFDSGTLRAPRETVQLRFTSIQGHRYYLKISQSSCAGATYATDLAPAGAFLAAPEATVECTTATAAARRGTRRLASLRSAWRRARAARRAALAARVSLQRQTVQTLRGETKLRCARGPLDGYPFA